MKYVFSAFSLFLCYSKRGHLYLPLSVSQKIFNCVTKMEKCGGHLCPMDIFLVSVEMVVVVYRPDHGSAILIHQSTVQALHLPWANCQVVYFYHMPSLS